jgi:hypothetical protein
MSILVSVVSSILSGVGFVTLTVTSLRGGLVIGPCVIVLSGFTSTMIGSWLALGSMTA